MKRKTEAQKIITTFLVLIFILVTPFFYFIIKAGSLNTDGGIYLLGLTWSPAIAAIATRLYYQRNIRGIGWGWGKTKYQFASYLIPLLACVPVYGIVWITGIGILSVEEIYKLTNTVSANFGINWVTPTTAIIIIAVVDVAFTGLFSSLGEEIGWRGLLVPELAKISDFTKISLFSALVWALYHYPLIIFADYQSAAPIWYALILFTITIISASFILTWLRLRSGSIWTAVIFHASHNVFIQSIFDKFTINTNITEYLTTEFGAGLAIVYSLFAYICWRNRDKVSL